MRKFRNSIPCTSLVDGHLQAPTLLRFRKNTKKHRGKKRWQITWINKRFSVVVAKYMQRNFVATNRVFILGTYYKMVPFKKTNTGTTLGVPGKISLRTPFPGNKP